MKRIISTWAIVLLIALLIAAAVILRGSLMSIGSQAVSAITDRIAALRGATSVEPVPLIASGTIEARTITLASTVGGRLATVAVVEGQPVAAGQVIAELERPW